MNPTHHVHISEAQQRKLLKGGSIRIKHAHITQGKVPIFLTERQLVSLQNANAKGKGATLKFESQHQADYHVQHGGGLWSFVRTFASRAHNAIVQKTSEMPKLITQFLQKHGNQRIVQLYLGRKPLQTGIMVLGNLISRGELDRVRSELTYDKVAHSYLLLKLQDGLEFILEKNERVMIKTVISGDDRKELYAIPLSKDVTLKQFIENAALVEGARLWKYDAVNTNCQRFCYDMVKDSHLMPSDPRTLNALTPQNAGKLIETLGGKDGIVKFVTNLGSYVDVIKNGGQV
ncbi:MAG: hypothetical protein JWL77_6949 [Chthonomonadaceae bacterium]|nr:hypothetical protein [Chthonomonadaceae bacterium]